MMQIAIWVCIILLDTNPRIAYSMGSVAVTDQGACDRCDISVMITIAVCVCGLYKQAADDAPKKMRRRYLGLAKVADVTPRAPVGSSDATPSGSVQAGPSKRRHLASQNYCKQFRASRTADREARCELSSPKPRRPSPACCPE
ncbi:hypothetical protein L226DRAFT_87297 [Lentinus tigrinus ALCF2SS1-7]|uniref:uncharacterized protein n=1 Tax=Lentinus tigrinus ALCF2SS1-7 TaxID=1328758 RepID=UPI00116607DF|nr:hypothetical protein L226DRAFT_87297 [Lentinus tigrinus ALCF2SS1-7]